MTPNEFRCYVVRKNYSDQFVAAVEQRPVAELPDGEVLIEVAYSSVNYKDALAAQGHPGVARTFPHVPGIDAAGTVVESASSEYQVGAQVLVTSYGLGVDRWGGWAQYVRVPGEWIVPMPRGLALRQSMVLGTAGLTAGLCVAALQHHAIHPDAGEVLVTGATGGVGCLAVMLLAQIGYTVVAVSGKPDRVEWLHELGAARVIRREQAIDEAKRPMLATQWAGVVDTVGGAMLASLLRSVRNEGCVAACGLVGGTKLKTTVYPFILRGITLRGIDSAWCPMPRRQKAWKMISESLSAESLEAVAQTVGFADLPDKVQQIHSGNNVGRTVVDVLQ